MAARDPLRVVAVGQTPPPFGGQALGIEFFVTGRYEGVEVHHVRMAFSNEMAEVGKAKPGKVLHLAGLIARILWTRARTRATVLYYPPAGPDRVPIVRDLVLLLATRWAFRRTVFHFHAGGLSEAWPRRSRLLRRLFQAAYGKPDVAIQTSELAPPDGAFLGAGRTAIAHPGAPDAAVALGPREERSGEPPALLYAGVLRESKGVLVLVEACRLLRERGVDFRLWLMGVPESDAFAQQLTDAIAAAGLGDRTTLLGNRVDDDKHRLFHASDVFCYPTFFESETFGLVVAEAMQFELPVVGTHWRGVPSVVAEGESGLLVPVRDPVALADALASILRDPRRAREMGRRGREIYLERFTIERFREAMATALRGL